MSVSTLHRLFNSGAVPDQIEVPVEGRNSVSRLEKRAGQIFASAVSGIVDHPTPTAAIGEQFRVAKGVGDAVRSQRILEVAGIADQCPPRPPGLPKEAPPTRKGPQTPPFKPPRRDTAAARIRRNLRQRPTVSGCEIVADLVPEPAAGTDALAIVEPAIPGRIEARPVAIKQTELAWRPSRSTCAPTSRATAEPMPSAPITRSVATTSDLPSAPKMTAPPTRPPGLRTSPVRVHSCRTSAPARRAASTSVLSSRVRRGA